MSMNKRIAELRDNGELLLECVIGCEETFVVTEQQMEDIDCCPACGYKEIKVYLKPYDTDIACAMELWEEMKGARLMPDLQVDSPEKPWEIRCFIYPEMPEGGHNHEGETEAEAIAGAWMKWKEG